MRSRSNFLAVLSLLVGACHSISYWLTGKVEQALTIAEAKRICGTKVAVGILASFSAWYPVFAEEGGRVPMKFATGKHSE